MEQAKAADGYLPKWRSNHLPRRRREDEKINHQFNFDVSAVLCCHPAAHSSTATSPLKLFPHVSTVGYYFIHQEELLKHSIKVPGELFHMCLPLKECSAVSDVTVKM